MTARHHPKPSLGRRAFLAGTAALAATPLLSRVGRAQAMPTAAAPIVLGEINSYSRLPDRTLPYRNGWKLAQERINGAGGLLGGRPLEVISRDDGGDPGNALLSARELTDELGAQALMGSFLPEPALALSDFAAQAKRPFLATEPLSPALVWAPGNRYTFRLSPNIRTRTAILAGEAATLPATRWAVVAADDAQGRATATGFLEALKALKPEIEVVADIRLADGAALDMDDIASTLLEGDPEAILLTPRGETLDSFLAGARDRDLFTDRVVAAPLLDTPADHLPAEGMPPETWIITGYPGPVIDTFPHRSFVKAYRAMWDADPTVDSLVGYNALTALAVAFEQAGTTDAEQVVNTLEGMTFGTPTGEVSFRAADHQSTMGTWLGRSAPVEGQGSELDGPLTWTYRDGAEVLPAPDLVKTWRTPRTEPPSDTANAQ